MYFESRFVWTIEAQHYPYPILHCSGCSGRRRFEPNGKVRLNANGKQLDCWLIYKCPDCDRTWNRPVFQRQPVSRFDVDTLAAMQGNDVQWVQPLLYDVVSLRRFASEIEQSSHYVISKTLLARRPALVDTVLVECRLRYQCGVRLERLLARELGIARNSLPSIVKAGRMTITPDGIDVLRRPLRNGTRIEWRGPLQQ